MPDWAAWYSGSARMASVWLHCTLTGSCSFGIYSKVLDPRAGPHQVAPGSGYVNKVVFAPNGNYFATGGQDHTIWLHALEGKGIQSTQLSTEKQSVYGLAFSPDGQWLASSCLGHEVKLWKLSGRKNPKILDNKADWSLALGFSGDGKYLAYGKGRKLVIWDMEKETPVDTLDSQDGIVTDAVWIHDEDEWGVFSVSLDDKMSAWTLKTRTEEVREFYQHTGGISAIAVSPDFKWLATGDGDNVVYLENLANLEKSQELISLGTSGKWFARQRWLSGVFHSSLNMLEHLHYFTRKKLPDGSMEYFVSPYSEQVVDKE